MKTRVCVVLNYCLFSLYVRQAFSPIQRTDEKRGREWVSNCYVTPHMTPNGHVHYLKEIIIYCLHTDVLPPSLVTCEVYYFY